MGTTFRIRDFVVGNEFKPYVIAEIGVNHEGDIKLAKALIEKAASGGAHAAKFQSYKAGKIASKHSPAYWDTTKESTDSQYKLFKKYDAFGEAEYRELAEHCDDVGIDFMSTPFDLDAVDFLSPLVPAFKIASADITNIPLIRKCASVGKPLILSTGAASLPEIEHALNVSRTAGAVDIAILHCVLNYPTPEDHAQLGFIKTLRRIFPDTVVGYSDHVVPDATISSLEVATLLGATILEKHFTHDKSLPGNDHYHAMDSEDLKNFFIKAKKYERMIDGAGKDLSYEIAARKHARRSIVAATSVRTGEVLTEDNLIAKRPGHGISPIHWDDVVGRTVTTDIEEDMIIHWGMFE